MFKKYRALLWLPVVALLVALMLIGCGGGSGDGGEGTGNGGGTETEGLVLVEGGIDTDKEKKVSAEILAQLSDLRNGKTDPDVLESSKRSLKERFTFTTPESICYWYASQLLEDEIRTPESIVEDIEKVTMEQVCEAAKKLSIDTIFMLKAQEEEAAEDEN